MLALNRSQKRKWSKEIHLFQKEIEDRAKCLADIVASQNMHISDSPAGKLMAPDDIKNLYAVGRSKTRLHEYLDHSEVPDAVQDELEKLTKKIETASDQIYEFLYQVYKLLLGCKSRVFWKWFYEVFRNYKEISDKTADYHIRKHYVKEHLETAIAFRLMDKSHMEMYLKLPLLCQYELYHILRRIKPKTRKSNKIHTIETVIDILNRCKKIRPKVTAQKFEDEFSDLFQRPYRRKRRRQASKYTPHEEIFRLKPNQQAIKWKGLLKSCGVSDDKIKLFAKHMNVVPVELPEAMERAMELFIEDTRKKSALEWSREAQTDDDELYNLGSLYEK